MDCAARNQPNVQVCETDGEQTQPRKQHVTFVEKSKPLPRPVPRTAEGDTRKAVDPAAREVPERVTRDRVKREQNDIDEQDHGSNADAEPPVEPERVKRVVPENDQEYEREVEKVTMQVLQNQWKRGLAAIFM